jgi:hypothetical protein
VLSRHRRLIVEVRRHAEEVPDLRRLLDHTNRRMHETFLERARACIAEIAADDAERALRFALFVAGAAAREAVLTDALRPYGLSRDRDRIVDDISRTVLASLTSA